MLRKKSQKGQISLVTKTISQLRTQNVEGGTQNEGGGDNFGPKDFQGKDNGNLWSYIIIIGWYIIEA